MPFDENVRLYLLVFLTDPRGINLRNRVAHGLLEQDQMERALTDRLVQVLLALSCFGPKEKDPSKVQPPTLGGILSNGPLGHQPVN